MEKKYSGFEYGVTGLTLLLLVAWATCCLSTSLPLGVTVCGGTGLLAMAAAPWFF